MKWRYRQSLRLPCAALLPPLPPMVVSLSVTVPDVDPVTALASVD